VNIEEKSSKQPSNRADITDEQWVPRAKGKEGRVMAEFLI
jgi:hypothetical protein